VTSGVLNSLMRSIVLASDDPLHHNYDFPILTVNGHVWLTNHMAMMILIGLLMLWLFPKGARAISTGKTGTSHDYVTKGTWARLFEVICIFMKEDVAEPMLGKNANKFLPFIWTMFFFILLNNLFGLVPLLDMTSLVLGPVINGSHAEHVEGEAPVANEPHEAAMSDHTNMATGEEKAASESGVVWFQDFNLPGIQSHFEGFGGTATGNIAVTFGLSLIAALVIIGSGIQSLGLLGFLKHLTLDAPVLLWPLMVVLEIIGLIVKPFALMVRLFANMTAGHAMLAALLGFCSMAWNGLAIVPDPASLSHWGHSAGGTLGALMICAISVIASSAIGMLEILVAFIQAFIFTFLTVVFISLYQHGDHEHEHHPMEQGHAHGHESVFDIEPELEMVPATSS